MCLCITNDDFMHNKSYFFTARIIVTIVQLLQLFQKFKIK